VNDFDGGLTVGDDEVAHLSMMSTKRNSLDSADSVAARASVGEFVSGEFQLYRGPKGTLMRVSPVFLLPWSALTDDSGLGTVAPYYAVDAGLLAAPMGSFAGLTSVLSGEAGLVDRSFLNNEFGVRFDYRLDPGLVLQTRSGAGVDLLFDSGNPQVFPSFTLKFAIIGE
jgi:hypothetical protein